MRQLNRLIILLMLTSLTTFASKKYTLRIDDFKNQFSNSIPLKRVYCTNESGAKVWLDVDKNSLLILRLKTDKEYSLVLRTVQLNEGIIEGLKQSSFNKKNICNLNEVLSITILAYRGGGEQEFPYFDLEECRKNITQKNDSIRNDLRGKESFAILLIKKTGQNIDTIHIMENVCYNLKFNDNNKTSYGLVHTITQDSISISNYYNVNVAREAKEELKIWARPINTITEIHVLGSGGYMFKNLKVSECLVIVKKVKKDEFSVPCWFGMDSRTGETALYRLWLTNRGFLGITEKKGKIYWYEGG